MNTKKTMLALALCAVTIGGVAAYIHTRTHGAFASGKYVWQRQEWKSGCETFRVGEHLKATGYEDARGRVGNEYAFSPNTVWPDTLDNRAMCLPPYDQDNYPDLRLCGECATCAYMNALYWKQTGRPIRFDPRHLYEVERARHTGNGGEMNGACFDCMMHFVKSEIGYGDEYRLFNVLGGALEESGTLQDCVPIVKHYVHRDGVALVMVMCRETWRELKRTGKTVIPSGGKEPIGHAVVVCGYNKDGFIIQNSWGRDWGDNGFGLIRYEDFIDQYYMLVVFEKKELVK